MTRDLKKLIVASLLATLVAFGSAVPVFARTSEEIAAEIEVAQAELDELYARAEEVSEELNHTKILLDETAQKISDTQQEIVEKQEELAEAQQTLGERVASTYKAGGVTLLNIVLDSSSFEELVSNIYYADKIAQSDADAIAYVKQVKAELSEKEEQLEKEKAEEETLLAQQKEQKAELDARAAEAEAYVAGLDEELQIAIEEERRAAEEAARRAAEEAARQAAEEAARQEAAAAAQQAQQTTQQEAQTTTNNESSSSNSSSSNSSSSNSSSSANTTSYSSSMGSGTRATIVAAAQSKLGCAYVWGAEGPSSFDCSGFTKWCYAQAGIYIDHYSGSQGAFCNKPASQAEPGDVVYRPGHVGIYIGGGTVIHASTPSTGVIYGSLSSFTYAGAPF